METSVSPVPLEEGMKPEGSLEWDRGMTKSVYLPWKLWVMKSLSLQKAEKNHWTGCLAEEYQWRCAHLGGAT